MNHYHHLENSSQRFTKRLSAIALQPDTERLSFQCLSQFQYFSSLLYKIWLYSVFTLHFLCDITILLYVIYAWHIYVLYAYFLYTVSYKIHPAYAHVCTTSLAFTTCYFSHFSHVTVLFSLSPTCFLILISLMAFRDHRVWGLWKGSVFTNNVVKAILDTASLSQWWTEESESPLSTTRQNCEFRSLSRLWINVTALTQITHYFWSICSFMYSLATIIWSSSIALIFFPV